MAYCVPLGIPHSEFLRWSEEDQDKALAYNRRKALACGDCGTRDEEWAEDPDYWIGDIYHCEGCARLAQERKNLPEGDAGAGFHVRLLPKAVALARLERGEGLG